MEPRSATALPMLILADAAQDARVRAERSGSVVVGLVTARMGVVQVNAANESETSAEGMNDTSIVEKDAFAVVRSVFQTR